MKIEVSKWIFDSTHSYKIKSLVKCCDEIINSDVVTLVEDYENGDDTDYSVKLRNVNYEYDSYDDTYDDYTTYESIKHCPFCGERIDIEIVEIIDKNEEYLKLTQLRDELWNKYIKTDSIKKSNKLQQEVRELDKKINEIHMNDDLKGEIQEE